MNFDRIIPNLNAMSIVVRLFGSVCRSFIRQLGDWSAGAQTKSLGCIFELPLIENQLSSGPDAPVYTGSDLDQLRTGPLLETI